MPGCNTTPSQHLFLGLSVSSISCNAGYGEQSTEVNVTLVEDTDPCGSKVYYDRSLNRQIHTGADPGFIYPRTGSPVYFRLEDFEFTGLLQKYEKNVSSSGITWTVNLISPSIILKNTNVILSNYIGRSNMVANAINTYGAAEYLFSSDGVVCSDAYSGFFGGADYNESGIPWSKIRDTISALTSSVTITTNLEKFLGRGRLTYKGNSDFMTDYATTPGYGLLFDDGFSSFGRGICYYLLDISDLPNNTPDNYRFGGTMSVLDLVSQVCEDTGSDFMVELFPLKMSDSLIYKVIKVRRILRNKYPPFVTSQPEAQFDAFIARTEVLNGGKKVVSAKSAGRELANDEPTSVLIYGGPKETPFYFEKERTKMYWGINSSGNMIREVAVNSEDFEENPAGDTFYVPYEIGGLIQTLDNPNLFLDDDITSIKIYEYEMLAALEGYDSWEGWISAAGEDAVDSFGSVLFDKINAIFGVRKASAFIIDLHEKIVDEEPIPAFPDDIRLAVFGDNPLNPKAPFADLDEKKSTFLRDLESVYNFVRNIADTYYGKKYAVALPNICVDNSEADDTKRYSVWPTESGWLENSEGKDATSILGLAYPYLSFFSDEQNKITPFARLYNLNSYRINDLSPDDYISYTDEDNNIILYLHVDLDTDRIAFLNGSSFSGPHAIVTIPYIEEKPVEGDLTKQKDLLQKQIQRALIAAAPPPAPGDAAFLATSTEIVKQLAEKNGHSLLNLSIKKRPLLPWNMATVLPFRSNIVTYGPWYYDGPPGLTKVEYNTDLVPWNLGSIANMNDVGEYLVETSQTPLQSQDSGSITTYGVPLVNLGRELNYPTLINIDNRIAATGNVGPVAYIYIGDPLTNADFGPVVTSINIEIGDGGFTTRYDMRTYSPKYAKFARENYERLKNLGVKKAKQDRSLNLLKIRNIKTSINNASGKERLKRALNPETPSSILVGQILDSDTNNISVTLGKSKELFSEASNEYSEKAMMSLDGLFIPVQKGGIAQMLPEMTSANGSQQLKWGSREIEGPIKDEPILGGSLFGTSKLDPLMTKAATKFHTGETHHDVKFVAKGEDIPDFVHDEIKEVTSGDGYEAEDARFFALKGPLMLNSWGLDLDGKPIPNESDEFAEDGIFGIYGKTDKFFPNWLQKRKACPTAPVDLRFDRNRGVWTFPGGFRIMRVKMSADLITSAEGIILEDDGNVRYDSDGQKIEEKKIDVFNPFFEDSNLENAFEILAYEDDIVLVYFNSFKNKYYFITKIQSSSIGNNIGIYKFTLTENMDLGDTATATISDPQSPHVNVVVYDPTNEMFRGEIGYDGLCYRIDNELFDATPKYRIIWMEGKARWTHFTLQGMFDGDGVSEGAAVNYYCLQGKDPGTTVDIYDLTGRFKYTDTAAQGIALYDDIQDRYVAVSCDDLPFQCMATLEYDLCFNSSMAYLKHVNPEVDYTFFEIGEYRIPVPNNRVPLTALNPFKHTGKKDDKVLLLRSKDTWYVTDVQRKEGIFIQEIGPASIVSEGVCLEQKTFRFVFESCHDLTPSPFAIGSSQEVVTDVYLDSEGSPTALMKSKASVIVVCPGNSVESEIIDLTNCPEGSG